MSNEINKTKIISSLFWKFLERGGAQGVQLIVQIILARLLSPEDFGTIALVIVFISIAQVFVQSGLNTALIQKKHVEETESSSVFYLSLSIALIMYFVIYITAPFIASFYGTPVLTSILRVLSITLFFGAFNSIQNAYISRNMMFKELFYCSIGSFIISGIGGIIAAYAGLGVWALVIQQLLSQSSNAIIMWFTVKWRPTLQFSIERVKTLFSFGWKLLISSLVTSLYDEIRTLFIGKAYNPAVLGHYNRGQSIPQLLVSSINSTIQAVMFPTLASVQDNRNKVKQMVRRSIAVSAFFIFPMMIGLIVTAKPLIKIILTDKWLPAVPFLQIYCLYYTLIPIHTANLQAINAIGRSDISLKLNIVKKTIGLIILVISLPFGVYAIALGQLLYGIIASFINAYPNKQLLDYSYKDQLKDIIPSLIIALLMGFIVNLLNIASPSTWQLLVLQIILGIIIYFALAKLCRLEIFDYLIETIKQQIFIRKTKD